MKKLSPIENVVRVIFPLTMIRDGELLPAAFKLREMTEGPEKYISIFRQYAESFNADVTSFDNGRNLPCCIMNVGEVDAIRLMIRGNRVNYRVEAIPTPTYLSHGGIFLTIGDIPIEGNGLSAFTALNIGEESAFHMVAIRRRLMEIAKKRITTLPLLVSYNTSSSPQLPNSSTPQLLNSSNL